MQSKSLYRGYFADVQKYVKMKVVLADLGMTPTNYYRFMKGKQYDYYMSLDMLEIIKQGVQRTLEKLT